MKARLILISIALAFCFPAVAHADLYDELDGLYNGYFWSNSLSDDYRYPTNTQSGTGVGFASINLVLNDIYAYNTDLARVAASPAGNLAVQITQLDFIRGTYGRLTQIYNLQSQSFLPALNELRRNTANLNNMYDYVTEISSTALGINTNLTVVNQRLNTLITGQSSQSEDLILINENANGIYTTLTRFLDVSTANQYALGNQLRSYFHPDPNGDGSGAGYIFGELDSIRQNQINGTSLFSVLDEISSKLDNLNFEFPSSIEVSNMPTEPFAVNVQNFPNQQTVDLTAVINRLDYIVKAFQSVDTINGYTSYRALIRDMFQSFNTINGMISFRAYIRAIFAGVDKVNGRTSLYSHILFIAQNIEQWRTEFNNAFSELFDYLTDDGLLKQIRDLLTVSNPDTVIGDFDGEQFDANVDDLTARLAAVAPFGALLMVSAELDILQSVTAVQQPEFNIPFNFFGTSTVNIDLGFMNDARPLFNFIVVFGFVYMLLIYTIDFVKEGEL